MTERVAVQPVSVETRIRSLRGSQVLLDSGLAAIGGGPTDVFHRVMQRNAVRFPKNVVFRLSANELASSRSQIVTSRPGRGVRLYMPQAARLHIFVSSVQKEFAKVRLDLRAFLLGDAVLRRFVAEVFLFEGLPARDQRADEVYLGEVGRCDVYLAILGYDYGSGDAAGISPTEHEFDEATRQGKTRLVYVWGSDEQRRDPKMKALVGKASGDLIRRRVEDASATGSCGQPVTSAGFRWRRAPRRGRSSPT